MGRVDKVPRPKVARQRLGTMKRGGRASTWNRPATLRFWRVEDELDGGWGKSRESGLVQRERASSGKKVTRRWGGTSEVLISQFAPGGAVEWLGAGALCYYTVLDLQDSGFRTV